jgi:hypothetical protein
MELSTMMEKSWSGQTFPWRKSLRWWADIQAEISARHAKMHVATWGSEGAKERDSCVIRIEMIGESI